MLDRLLEFGRDLGWIASAFKTDWRTDLDRGLVGLRHSPSCLLQFEQSINTHGDNRNTQVVYQKTYTGAERSNLAVGGVVPLREDQDAKAAKDLQRAGVRVHSAHTIMRTMQDKTQLARTVLSLVASKNTAHAASDPS